jgi:P27 family predicted phage terminase small subunit
MPAHLKMLRGNPGQRVIHPELDPAKAPGIPDPPSFLTAEAKGEWRRIGAEAYRLGLLSIVDERAFANYCQAFGRWLAAEKLIARMAKDDPVNHGLLVKSSSTGNMIKNPLLTIASVASSEMMKHACEFGFTPASRARIAAGVAAGNARSKFAGLVGGEDTGRKAAGRQGHQVHRVSDGAEWEGPGQAVQAGAISEKLDS